MESAAIAKVCNVFDIPFMTIRYITDNSEGKKAHRDWEKNLKDASAKFNNIFRWIYDIVNSGKVVYNNNMVNPKTVSRYKVKGRKKICRLTKMKKKRSG